MSFWSYIILLITVNFLWDIESVGFQWLFRYKLPVDRHFLFLKLSNITLKIAGSETLSKYKPNLYKQIYPQLNEGNWVFSYRT